MSVPDHELEEPDDLPDHDEMAWIEDEKADAALDEEIEWRRLP